MKSIRTVLAVLCCLLFLAPGLLKAEDPDQYATPFADVPDSRDAVIYQVNTRCFSSSGDLQGVIARLDNLESLGVNTIYLMPIQPVGAVNSVNSPYCIADYTSVGSEFGSLADLRTLVDGAHQRGMAVILDWVANHTAWDHPWISEHPDWYEQDEDGNIVSPDDYSDVAQLNFDNSDMVDAMIDAMRYWIFAANIDGFRCDFADNPPVSFWTSVISDLRSITTHDLLLLAEGARTENYTAGFDYIFGNRFYYNSIKPIFTSGASVTTLDDVNSSEYENAGDMQHVARYLTNHDVYGSEGSPINYLGGASGNMAIFVVMAYMKGVPFIYNGMEVANTVELPFPFTSTSIDWSANLDVTEEYTKVIALRHSSTAIQRGDLTTYNTDNVCAFKKVSGSETVLVLVNLKNSSQTFSLPSEFANTTMNDAYTGTAEALTSSISLDAYEYRVFTTENSDADTAYYFIKNKWLNANLYDDGDTLSYGDVTGSSAQWISETNSDGYVLFKNRSTGDYINIESRNDYAECTFVEETFWSAQWLMEDVDGYQRLQNRWQTGEYLHLEDQTGYAQHSDIDAAAWSSQWLLQAAADQ